MNNLKETFEKILLSPSNVNEMTTLLKILIVKNFSKISFAF